MLRKAIQSANLNFLIGSGCTVPAIPPLGNIENDIQKLISEGKSDEAEILVFQFLKPFIEVTEKMGKDPDVNIKETEENYKTFLANIFQILFERKNNLLPKQASIFSTNYDLFIEKTFEEVPTLIKLNDGFNRSPSITGLFRFSSSEFFNSVYNNGNLYNYQVQIPSINLIKLHGSLSWMTRDEEIIYSIDDMEKLLNEYNTLSIKKDIIKIKEFNKRFSIVLPKKEKFKDTLLNQTYYDLLRLYANELDKENTLLIVEGFSFEDEHVLEITKRALKNPTLKIVIFCFAKNKLDTFCKKFNLFNNVDVMFSETGISFNQFNSTMKEILPELLCGDDNV